VAVLGGEFGN